MAERLFSTYQLAELLGTTHQEVVSWIERGWLPFKRLPNGPLRISETHLVQFLKGRGVDLQELLARVAPEQTAATATASSAPAGAAGIAEVIDELRATDLLQPADDDQISLADEQPAESQAAPIPSPPASETVTAAQPAEQVAEAILRDAAESGATHVHLDLRGGELMLSLRINGAMHGRPRFGRLLPPGLAPRLVAQLKTAAGIGEPAPQAGVQTGRLAISLKGREQAFALSACNTGDGQRIILTAVALPWAGGLESVGLTGDEAARLRRTLRQPAGLVLLSGGAGSGCGNLLRAMLHETARGGGQLLAAQGPGRPLDAATYCRLGDGRFATAADVAALAAMDGEVIAVENLADSDALAAAVEAALDGRLVLASVMQRTAAATIAMLQAAAKPLHLASAMLALVELRSARALCPACKRRGEALDDGDAYEPAGCDRCGGSGYAGRLAIPAVWYAEGEALQHLRAGQPAGNLLASLREATRQAGLARVRNGEICPDEMAVLLER